MRESHSIFKMWWGSFSSKKMWEGNSTKVTVVMFEDDREWQHLIISMSTIKSVDNEGFDPSTSRMLSVRSTNWASRPLNRLTQLLLVMSQRNCCNRYFVLKFFNIQHSDTFRFVSFLMFLSTFRRFIRLVAHQDWIRRNTMDVAQVLKLVFLN